MSTWVKSDSNTWMKTSYYKNAYVQPDGETYKISFGSDVGSDDYATGYSTSGEAQTALDALMATL